MIFIKVFSTEFFKIESKVVSLKVRMRVINKKLDLFNLKLLNYIMVFMFFFQKYNILRQIVVFLLYLISVLYENSVVCETFLDLFLKNYFDLYDDSGFVNIGNGSGNSGGNMQFPSSPEGWGKPGPNKNFHEYLNDSENKKKYKSCKDLYPGWNWIIENNLLIKEPYGLTITPTIQYPSHLKYATIEHWDGRKIIIYNESVFINYVLAHRHLAMFHPDKGKYHTDNDWWEGISKNTRGISISDLVNSDTTRDISISNLLNPDT